jgi:hypothetical protein
VKLLSTKQNYAGMLLFRLVCHLNKCRQINGRRTKYERLLGGNQTGHAGCFGLEWSLKGKVRGEITVMRIKKGQLVKAAPGGDVIEISLAGLYLLWLVFLAWYWPYFFVTEKLGKSLF